MGNFFSAANLPSLKLAWLLKQGTRIQNGPLHIAARALQSLLCYTGFIGNKLTQSPIELHRGKNEPMFALH